MDAVRVLLFVRRPNGLAVSQMGVTDALPLRRSHRVSPQKALPSRRRFTSLGHEARRGCSWAARTGSTERQDQGETKYQVPHLGVLLLDDRTQHAPVHRISTMSFWLLMHYTNGDSSRRALRLMLSEKLTLPRWDSLRVCSNWDSTGAGSLPGTISLGLVLARRVDSRSRGGSPASIFRLPTSRPLRSTGNCRSSPAHT